MSCRRQRVHLSRDANILVAPTLNILHGGHGLDWAQNIRERLLQHRREVGAASATSRMKRRGAALPAQKTARDS